MNCIAKKKVDNIMLEAGEELSSKMVYGKLVRQKYANVTYNEVKTYLNYKYKYRLDKGIRIYKREYDEENHKFV